MTTLELLTSYNWVTNESTPYSGTEDWVEVATLGDQGGYEWTDFNVFYSPAARRYFWYGASGCSCNSWGDDLSSAADFENGDRAALLRAWETFAKESYGISVTDYTDGVTTIHAFKESK